MTSKEIAKIAGVSRGTVDRALHGREGVRPEVREKILKIAKEGKYTPDRAGKALSYRKKDLKIGIVFHNNGNPFFEPVIAGIEKAERDFADFSLHIIRRETESYSAAEQLEAIEALESEGISALILVPVNDPDISKRIESVTAAGIPVIFLNSDMESHSRLCYVGCDYIESGKIAAQTAGLITGGRAKAAIITGNKRILGHRQRIEGFQSVAMDFPALEVTAVKENNDSDELCYLLVKEILKTERPELLFFAAGGVTGGLRAIAEQGKPYPKIIACDETPATQKALNDGLVQAIISQQPYEQGYRSVSAAFDAVVNKKVPQSGMIYTQNRLLVKYCK